MAAQTQTNRIEAFSDGVIAIIITVMVFDLKLTAIPTAASVWQELEAVLPKLLSYMASFTTLAIMWVSHHQFFQHVQHSNGHLLWLNIHLLFWMSLVPFATHFVGSNPMLWQAATCYGLVFLMSALAFTALRQYALKNALLLPGTQGQSAQRVKQKNRWAMGIYLLGALAAPASVYVAYSLFLVVPILYFMPEKINHQKADL